MRVPIAVILLGSAARLLAVAPAVAFEENRGQAPCDVAFLVHAGGARLWLARDGSLLAAGNGGSVRVRLAGAGPAKPAGLHLLAAKSNYLTGSDRALWHIGIPNYQEVRYAHAYPGIDVVWHARGGQVEHDFVVAPGADPLRIRLAILGASPEITTEQDLVAGAIRFHKPRAYQDGREVACRFELRGRTASFVLGGYDRNRPLTIDPTLVFSTVLGGGSGANSAQSVSLDGAGNIYVAGTTTSADFPVTAGALQQGYANGQCESGGTNSPCPDIFVTKFTGDGSTLLFSTYLGGGGFNSMNGMAVDRSGNVYLAGDASLPNLSHLAGYTALPSDPFVAKLSADGSALLYATTLPLDGSATINALAVDGAGAVYLTGYTAGGLPLVNAFQNTISQPPVFKTTDSAAQWQGLAGGLPSDLVSSITVDPGNPQIVYLGMWQTLYKSTDAGGHWTAILQGTPPQAPYPSVYLSPNCAVDPSNSQVVYLATDGNGIYKSTDGGMTWSPAWTGASRFARTIAIDPANTSTLYAANDDGLYKSTDGAQTWKPTGLMAGPNVQFFVSNVVLDPSTPTTVYAATANGVMKSLDAGVTWTAMTNGFTQSTDITSLAIDPVNPQALYAAVTGYNAAPFFTSDGGAHWTQSQWSPQGGLLPYVLWLLVDPSVHTTIWAATDEALLVSRDSGATWSAPPTDLPYYNVQRLASGSDGSIYAIANSDNPDAFALKLDPTGSKIVYCTYLGGSGPDDGQSIAVDSAGRAYIAGFTSSFDFPLANALQSRPGGMFDAFVAVLGADGSNLAWSTYLGGSNDDRAWAIALDAAGNVHLAGSTSSADFPLAQAAQATPAGVFAAKLKADGSALVFSTYFGGSGYDAGMAVGADAAGNMYVAGDTTSTNLPVANAIQTSLDGSQNGFVAAWNGQTGALQYATYLGGSGSDFVSALAADAAGDAYVAGYTFSPDFPRKYAFQYTFTGDDAFLAKIAPGATGPGIALAGASDAAGYGAVVSPGEIVSVFGKELAVTPAAGGAPPLPVQLSDVHATVNGVAAPLFYVSPLQINLQIPYETAAGTAQMQVASSAGTATLNVQVAAAAPGIFTVNSTGSGAGAIEHSLTGQLVTDTNPAAAGEIVSVYCTGLGAVSPAVATGAAAPVPAPQTVLAVEAFVAGAPAQVSYAGLAPGFAGLYQINVQIPNGIQSGTWSLQVSAGQTGSNTVTIAVH